MDERENLENIGHAMMLAWSRVKKAQARMWGDWMTIGEGLLIGRHWAMQQAGTNKPEGKGFVMNFSEWLKRFKVDDMDKSDRAKLLQLMEERPAVEEWRASLPFAERMRLNNPTIVWRKWQAATRVKKPKPRTAGVSATEHGRAQAMIDELQARNAELEEEIAQIRTTSGTGNPTDAVESFVEAIKALSRDEQQAALVSVADKLGLSDYDEQLGKLTEEQPSD
jgi:hypothetical protein